MRVTLPIARLALFDLKNPQEAESAVRRTLSLTARLGCMSDSKAMWTLEGVGYEDVDPDGVPTFRKFGRAVVQLDRAMILESSSVLLQEYTILDAPHTDHHATSLTVRIGDEPA